MEVPNVVFHPLISFIQKVILYETKNMFYVIGSNNSLSKYRVLKVDRTDPKDLVVVDDKVEYTQMEIHQLVERIETMNKSKAQHRSAIGKDVSAFGILGFVRFLEGYYIVLVTKRQKVAIIGHHSVYKIKDTAMIYIPNDNKKTTSPEEQRYLKIFQSVDLKSNFYFSYSYDLTHTLQMNLAPPSDFPISSFVNTPSQEQSHQTPQQTLHFGVRPEPNVRFVWNYHLLKPVLGTLHADWILYMTHGFVDQSNISVYGRSLYVTLIARRSNRYAGTRFLKRGANFEGYVANEVETEQVVHDAGVSSFVRGGFSSFVQMRGSIPGHWSQDVSKMVPKPQISFDLSDPFGETAGAHFNQLLCSYGAPIIILNLVKKREKKKHESILSEELDKSIQYLNQFLPARYALRYTSFDMARMNKTKDKNVMQRLAEIARWGVLKTGVFVTRQPASTHSMGWQSSGRQDSPRYQTGVVRVNCVDCLDRTNTAQFAVGKYALGYQLCSLGVLNTPRLEFDSDCVRMLEALYEDHGDTLALQYGGSQLVHRIKTYRKTAPWTSQGNDIMQTLSRYYSNTFSDSDKQNTINLFLGLFVPNENGPHVWETQTDYYLHHSVAMGVKTSPAYPISQWWNPDILKALPRALEEKQKKSVEMMAVLSDEECVDGYLDYHRPYELTVLSEIFTTEISHSVRDFMPNFTTNYSPFVVRVRPGRRREESGSKGVGKNPSLTGQSSTSSTASSGTSSSAESDESCSEEEEVTADSRYSPSKESSCSEGGVSFDKLFPPMKTVYGTQPSQPKKNDILVYRRYAFVHVNSMRSTQASLTVQSRIFPTGTIPEDTVFDTRPPVVSQEAVEKYKQYVSLGILGACEPAPKDCDIYQSYVTQA